MNENKEMIKKPVTLKKPIIIYERYYLIDKKKNQTVWFFKKAKQKNGKFFNTKEEGIKFFRALKEDAMLWINENGKFNATIKINNREVPKKPKENTLDYSKGIDYNYPRKMIYNPNFNEKEIENFEITVDEENGMYSEEMKLAIKKITHIDLNELENESNPVVEEPKYNVIEDQPLELEQLTNTSWAISEEHKNLEDLSGHKEDLDDINNKNVQQVVNRKEESGVDIKIVEAEEITPVVEAEEIKNFLYTEPTIVSISHEYHYNKIEDAIAEQKVKQEPEEKLVYSQDEYFENGMLKMLDVTYKPYIPQYSELLAKEEVNGEIKVVTFYPETKQQEYVREEFIPWSENTNFGKDHLNVNVLKDGNTNNLANIKNTWRFFEIIGDNKNINFTPIEKPEDEDIFVESQHEEVINFEPEKINQENIHYDEEPTIAEEEPEVEVEKTFDFESEMPIIQHSTIQPIETPELHEDIFDEYNYGAGIEELEAQNMISQNNEKIEDDENDDIENSELEEYNTDENTIEYIEIDDYRKEFGESTFTRETIIDKNNNEKEVLVLNQKFGDLPRKLKKHIKKLIKFQIMDK